MRSSSSVVRVFLSISISLLISFGISCGTKTEISSQWRSPEYKGGPMHKILVIGVAKTSTARRNFEDRFAEALRGSGADAVPSYQFLPTDERLSDEQLAEVLRRDAFDGVLVTRLLGVKEKTTYVPPSSYVVPSYRGGYGYGYYGYYGRSYDVVHSAGYTRTEEVVRLETRLWNVADSQLAWGIISETFNPTSIKDGTASVTKKLVQQLAQDGLLAK